MEYWYQDHHPVWFINSPEIAWTASSTHRRTFSDEWQKKMITMTSRWQCTGRPWWGITIAMLTLSEIGIGSNVALQNCDGNGRFMGWCIALKVNTRLGVRSL
jgi:hypothetical protein